MQEQQAIEMVPVTSSAIKEIGKTTNHIRYNSGALYFYPECPAEVFEALRSAESKGRMIPQIKKYHGVLVEKEYRPLIFRACDCPIDATGCGCNPGSA